MNMFHKSRVYMKVVMDTKLSDDVTWKRRFDTFD